MVSLAWIWHFFPDDRREYRGPAGGRHRAFTETCGWVDVSILLHASDWPWTFGEPPVLESLHVEGNDPQTSVHWSADGSVLVVRCRWNQDSEELYSAAYDYRDHRLIRPRERLNPGTCDQMIQDLLASRGGCGPIEEAVGDLKSRDPLRPFPAWGWGVFVGWLLIGMVGAGAMLRGRIGTKMANVP